MYGLSPSEHECVCIMCVELNGCNGEAVNWLDKWVELYMGVYACVDVVTWG